MKAEGQGEPPCAYALCVLGSAGRGESLLAMDQDNAIVFADGEPGDAADRWFARFGGIVADILHEVGVPYCKGGVMAKNDAVARLARDLARAHRRLDRALQSRRPAVGRYLLRSGGRAWRRRAGEGTMARRVRRRARQCRFRQAAGGSGRRGGERPQHLGRLAHREWPHRSQEGGPVRHRHHRARAGDPSSSARALDAGAAVGDRRARPRRRPRPRRAGARARRCSSISSSTQQLADMQAGLPPGNKVAVKRLEPRAARRVARIAGGAVRHLDALTRDLLF